MVNSEGSRQIYCDLHMTFSNNRIVENPTSVYIYTENPDVVCSRSNIMGIIEEEKEICKQRSEYQDN